MNDLRFALRHLAISRLLAPYTEGLPYDTWLDGPVLGFTLATVLVTARVSFSPHFQCTLIQTGIGRTSLVEKCGLVRR